MGMGNICQSLFINILMIKFISQKCGHCGIVRRLPHFHVFCGHSYRSRALIFLFFVAVDACEQQTKSNVRQEAAEALLCMESPTSENKTFLQGISQPQHGKLLPDPQTPTNLNEGGFV